MWLHLCHFMTICFSSLVPIDTLLTPFLMSLTYPQVFCRWLLWQQWWHCTKIHVSTVPKLRLKESLLFVLWERSTAHSGLRFKFNRLNLHFRFSFLICKATFPSGTPFLNSDKQVTICETQKQFWVGVKVFLNSYLHSLVFPRSADIVVLGLGSRLVSAYRATWLAVSDFWGDDSVFSALHEESQVVFATCESFQCYICTKVIPLLTRSWELCCRGSFLQRIIFLQNSLAWHNIK